jgi:hypothetical protein
VANAISGSGRRGVNMRDMKYMKYMKRLKLALLIVIAICTVLWGGYEK